MRMNYNSHKTTEELLALFTVSKLEVLNFWELPNGYYSKSEEPWLLVQTMFGMIEIGWRKRVINIDWTHTKCNLPVTKDDVTHDTHMVHAWSYEKALVYLNVLAENLKEEQCTGLENTEKAKIFQRLGLMPTYNHDCAAGKTSGYGKADEYGNFEYPLGVN